MSSSEDEKLEKSWTFEDKKQLLLILHQHGARNLQLIQQMMPYKSVSEIRYICNKHTKQALSKWHHKPDNRDPTIKQWLNILRRISLQQNGQVKDIIPRTLKYIALFEKRADSTYIDLRDCYFVLSAISNGLASKKMDEPTIYFFYECLKKFAKKLKNGDVGPFKSFLKKLKELDTTSLEGNTLSRELSHIINQLNVPNELLKMSKFENAELC